MTLFVENNLARRHLSKDCVAIFVHGFIQILEPAQIVRSTRCTSLGNDVIARFIVRTVLRSILGFRFTRQTRKELWLQKKQKNKVSTCITVIPQNHIPYLQKTEHPRQAPPTVARVETSWHPRSEPTTWGDD